MRLHGGLFAGAPDVLIFTEPPLKKCRGVAIELKRIGGKGPSPQQTEWLEGLRACGWDAFVSYGADEAISELKKLGFGIQERM
jgi:hypothetical protein